MHKCIKCGKTYENNNKEILEKGCECGNKLFLFIPEKKEEKEKIEKENFVYLPLESIRVVSEGKYLIDLSKLFKEKVIVIKSKEGKYYLKITPLKKQI